MFFTVKKAWMNGKISLRTRIRISKKIVMAMVKYGFETWALQKTEKDLLGVFQRNSL